MMNDSLDAGGEVARSGTLEYEFYASIVDSALFPGIRFEAFD